MYLRHHDNDQNGPTFSEGGGGVASGSTKPQNWKKNKLKTATKIRLKPKIASKTVWTDFSHPSCQNPNRSNTDDRWSTKRSHSYGGKKIAAQIKEELEPK